MRGLRIMRAKPAHYLEYGLVKLFGFLVRFISIRGIQRFGDVLGPIFYHLVPIRKRVAQDHIRRAFPEYDEQDIERLLKASYASVSKTILEILKLPRLDREVLRAIVSIEGKEHLDRALEKGNGLIVVTYHFGNWELMGTATVLSGYPLDVIYQRQANPLSDAYINRTRELMGMRIIERGEAVNRAIRALKENRLVAFLSDQDAHEEGVFAPLFGRPASTPRGPAVLSLRLGIPIVTTVSIRNADGTHRVIITPLETERSGNMEEDVLAIASEFNRRLEQYIREQPSQWLWFHRRWKTRPSGDTISATSSLSG
jgi:KDO2-lipid IV(A) lauroyltransferase